MSYELHPRVWPDYFTELNAEIPWERRPDAPRRECWMNDFARSYTYGRGAGIRTYEAREWTGMVRDIRDKLSLSQGIYFEGCFANGYDGARDWLGWHSDDDPGIDHSKPIVVVSFGQARAIQTRIRPSPDDHNPIGKRLHDRVAEFLLEPGSVFVMPAGSQQTHQHRIPKVGHEVGPRLSLTFRGLLRGVE